MRYAEIREIKIYLWRDSIGPDLALHYYLTSPKAEGKVPDYWLDYDLERDDPALIQVIEELGKEANGEFASLRIIEIPDDVEFTIKESHGNEWIAEKHRTWGHEVVV